MQVFMFIFSIFNVSTRLVAWYSIVAKMFLLIQFHAVWGGGSIVASFFQIVLVFLIHFFIVPIF